MSLKISKDLVLPLDAVTQTFAILALRRIGKTYTASVMAEEFVAAGIPFVALDPTGAWWGLRAGADGKSEGLPVVIIGGPHGDVPLEPTAGKVIADLVVDHPGYYVLDLSSTENNSAQDRFATDFAERLYRRKNTNRSPMHLFVDEADSFAPQRPFNNQLTMLGAFETLVRRGGIRGIGTTLITQRAAVLNKNVLTQTDSLIVLQMNSPQDQDAMEDWVKRNGTKEQRDMMMDSLASLPIGEAWFWSPGWLREFKRIRIRQRRTFNSSATPKAGEKTIIPQKLAPVDLEKLGQEIKATIERAAEADPAALKRKSLELKQKVQSLEQKLQKMEQRPLKTETKIEKQEVPILSPKQEKLLSLVSERLNKIVPLMEDFKTLSNSVADVRREIGNRLLIARQMPKALPIPVVKPAHAKPPQVKPPVPVEDTDPVNDGPASLTKCETAIVSALARFPEGRTLVQVAVLSCYSHKSGSFKNSIYHLHALGIIARSDQTITLVSTPSKTTTLPIGQELRDWWMNYVTKCENAILKSVTEAYPEAKSFDQVAEDANYSVASGSFKNSIYHLRSLGLIDPGNPIKASDNLFQD